MKAIIVGCGRLGAALAYQMNKKGNHVVVIDQDVSTFANLPSDFKGRTIEGDVLDRNVLHRAEIENADAMAIVTASDSLNALVAYIAKTMYLVPRVVARNYDPRQRPLQEAFGVPVVGTASWGAQRIEELLSDIPLRIIYSDSSANFAIYMFKVSEDWQGHLFPKTLIEEQCKTLAWMRAGKYIPISPMQTLEAGDLIYLSIAPDEIDQFRLRLGIQQEQLT
jgi:trk system potassium uptake protein TrkA